MPPLEELAPPLLKALAESTQLAPSLDELLEIPLEVAPADLAALSGVPDVPRPAVADEVAPIAFSQQLLGDVRASTEADREDGNQRGDRRPEPRLLAAHPPTGLVHADRGCFSLDVGGCLFDALGEGVREVVLKRLDRPERDSDAEAVV